MNKKINNNFKNINNINIYIRTKNVKNDIIKLILNILFFIITHKTT